MGKCLSRIKGKDEEEEEGEGHTIEVGRAQDDEELGKERTFSEEEERRSADGTEKKGAGRRTKAAASIRRCKS